MEIAHLNVCSLVPKFESLRNHILDKGYCIFAISETWLNENIDDNSLHIPGYSIVRADRTSRGGGIALYVHKSVKYSRILTSTNIEQLWISIFHKGERYSVGVVYRSPNCDYKLFVDQLEESVILCTLQGEKIICLGDINIDFLDIKSASTRYTLDMMHATGLSQIINEPTHITATSQTLIDVIFCNNNSFTYSPKVGGLDLSDHELISCKLHCPKCHSEPFYYTYRSFKNFNMEAFTTDLQNLSLVEICYLKDIDQKVQVFNDKLLRLFDTHLPLKTSRITKKKPLG